MWIAIQEFRRHLLRGLGPHRVRCHGQSGLSSLRTEAEHIDSEVLSLHRARQAEGRRDSEESEAEVKAVETEVALPSLSPMGPRVRLKLDLRHSRDLSL